MSVAALHRLLTAVAVAASLGAAAYLLDARTDEAALTDASRALRAGDVSAGLARLDDARGGATTDGRAAALAAQAAVGLGDLRAALAHQRDAARARPNDWRMRLALATLLAVNGEVDAARREALRTLELNPRARLPSGFNVRPVSE